MAFLCLPLLALDPVFPWALLLWYLFFLKDPFKCTQSCLQWLWVKLVYQSMGTLLVAPLLKKNDLPPSSSSFSARGGASWAYSLSVLRFWLALSVQVTATTAFLSAWPVLSIARPHWPHSSFTLLLLTWSLSLNLGVWYSYDFLVLSTFLEDEESLWSECLVPGSSCRDREETLQVQVSELTRGVVNCPQLTLSFIASPMPSSLVRSLYEIKFT